MKRGIVFLITVLILLSAENTLAFEITYSKESYQPQELFQAKITGNFISLKENNIFIYKEGKAHPEPLIKDMTKQKNIYYFYAILPNEFGNYTIKIENAEYLERGIIKSETISKPLILELKNQSDLYINPGFIIPKKDFSIKVKSLFGNTDLKAKFELTGEEKILNLVEQKEETITFKLPAIPPQESKITINDYEIPVFLIKKLNDSFYNLEFIPAFIEGIVIPSNNYNFMILIKNPTERVLRNISFSSNLEVVFNPEKLETLEQNKTAFINFTIKIGNTDKNISGKIKANFDKEEFYIPINFIITKNESEVNIADSTNANLANKSTSLSCAQLGSICPEEQICNGNLVNSIEGNCCIGTCEEKSSSTKIAGIILIVLLILIIIYIIIKIRRNRNLKSPEEILEKKNTRYKKRMSNEVRGKLDNI